MEHLLCRNFLTQSLCVGIVLRVLAKEFHYPGTRPGSEVAGILIHIGLDNLGVAFGGMCAKRPLEPRVPRITDSLYHRRGGALRLEVVTIECLLYPEDKHEVVLAAGDHVVTRQHGIGPGCATIRDPHQWLVLKPYNTLQAAFGDRLELENVVVNPRHAGFHFLDMDSGVTNRLTYRHLRQFPKCLFHPAGTARSHPRTHDGYFSHLRCPHDLMIPLKGDAALGLPKRDAGLVLGEPGVEALQRGVEGSGDLEVARAAEVFVEVMLELEHVAQVLGPRETKAAVHLGWHGVV